MQSLSVVTLYLSTLWQICHTTYYIVFVINSVSATLYPRFLTVTLCQCSTESQKCLGLHKTSFSVTKHYLHFNFAMIFVSEWPSIIECWMGRIHIRPNTLFVLVTVHDQTNNISAFLCLIQNVLRYPCKTKTVEPVKGIHVHKKKREHILCYLLKWSDTGTI